MQRAKRIIFGLFLGFVLLLGSLYLYFFVFGGLERLVNVRLASLLERKYDLRITVGDVRGSLFSGIVLKDVVIRRNDGGLTPPLLTLSTAATAYSLSNLWQHRYLFDYLYLDSAVITILRDSTGNYLLPRLSSSSKSKEQASPVEFLIEDVGLSSTTLNLISPGDTLRLTRLNLSAAVGGRDNTYAVDLKHLSFESSDRRLALTSASGKATYAEKMIVLSDCTVLKDDTRLKLKGNILLRDTPTGNLTFSLDNFNLADTRAFTKTKLTGVIDANGDISFSGKKIAGSVDVAGEFLEKNVENVSAKFSFDGAHLVVDTLFGTILENCTIDGNGEIDFSAPVEHYSLNAELTNFNLNKLVPNTFESDLTGSLALTGQSFRNDRLTLHLQTSLHESSFDEYPLHEAEGSLLITTDSLCFADSFRINYFENVFFLSGCIEYSDSINLTVTAELNNLDRYRGKLFIDQPGGRGHAEATISGRTADPDLRGMFVSDSLWLYGLFSQNFAASVELERFLTGKHGSVEAFFFDGTAWSQPYDSGYTFLLVDSTVVTIDTFSMSNPYTHLVGKGRFDYGVTPMAMTIDTLTLTLFDQVFYNREALQIAIDSAGFHFLRSEISDGFARLSVSGRVNYDESMDINTSLKRIPVKPWLSLYDTSLAISGILSCDAHIEGTFLKPRFSLLGTVDSLTYQDLLLGNVVADLSYEQRRLSLDSVLILSETGTYHAQGSFYVDLAFTSEVVDRFPDLPMDIHFTATDSSFDLVSFLMPSVEQLNGDFFADILLTGTPQSPHLEGEAYIKNARLKYFELEYPLYADSAGVTMKDNKIIIDHIEAYTAGKKGHKRKSYAYIEGEITVKSLDNFYYDLDITLPKEFPFSYELDDIRGVVEGELHVEGDTPPLVTGDLTITSMKYLVNFASEDEGSPLMHALSGENPWDLNINIDVLANYWIKNDDIDAEFSGQINLIREKGVYRFIGEMEILRGRGFLFDKTFRLEPGSKVIFEGNPEINPRLDITGCTRIAGTRHALDETTETTESLQLCIHVTGTLEEPDIRPAEGSGFAREDILPILAANYYSSDSISSSTQFEQRLSGLVSSQISQIGARHLGHLGVETFEIDPIYNEKNNPFQAWITVGFYTAPNLYVYGRSTLSGQTRQEVGFEYRFSKAFLIEGLRDEQELYHLALKLHWEF